MAWNLKWGPHVKAFKAQEKATGVAPNPLKNWPKLLKKDLVYSEAFEILKDSRTYNQSAPNPIMVSELLAFCVLVGIANQEERLKYLRLVQALDKVWLNHWVETHK